ncbi:formate dehydrogenase major subunit [Desulfohalotomaculum tongense]|nr:formate dehydrogenase major subunit [Desulforadius tongensis]
MTNHFVDYQHTDVFLMIGSNSAENHPQSMRWIGKAKRNRGAKLIVVDPRLTKSTVYADIFARHRPGTDIPFLLGIMNYAIQNNLYHKEYVVNYTNASYLVNPEFGFNDGLFSGAGEKNGRVTYDKATWQYQKDGETIKKDPTLKHPNCVFQLLKKHVSRYDIKTVSNITGIPEDVYRKVCETFASTGAPNKSGNIIYAMGITQHTTGTQNVRAIAMLQLLLGNIGRPGGGVNAQRGESNVQGSTDLAMLSHLLPGYLGVPNATKHKNLQDYIERETPASGYWKNKPKFLISLLKAFYGQHAAKENDFCFDLLPKVDGKNRTHMGIFQEMMAGNIKGFLAWGQNPAVGGPGASYERKAMEKLDWLVVVDLFETETAAFWHAPGVNPQNINTEVFLLPAAFSYEKQGTVTNSGRWIQWRYQAVNPPGEAKSDLWIADRLFKAIRKEYQSGGRFPDPILKMNWDYDIPGHDEPDVEKVAVEINGYEIGKNEPLDSFGKLKDDGSTACGMWIYTGYMAVDKDLNVPNCKRRSREDSGLGSFLKYSFSWPLNRRIIYNRCAADMDGNPWDPERALFKWDGNKWICHDVPDFGGGKPPRESGAAPFIMLPEGHGRLFASGPVDGPFPEHYEPMESPTENIISKQQAAPCANVFKGDWAKLAELGDPNYPIVATTHRTIEHYQSGAVTRSCPTLAEIGPYMYVSVSEELAKEKGIKPGDDVWVETARGKIKCKASVLPVVKPLIVNGRKVEIVGMPWCFGYQGIVTGPVANDLVPAVGDGNTSIPESKAFMCNIRKA